MELFIKKVFISVKKIGTKNYNRAEDSFDLFAVLNIDEKEENVIKRYKFTNKPEEVNLDFIKFIKSGFADNNYDSGTFSHNLVTIHNHDEVEDKMLSFIKKVNDKIKDFKNSRSSMSYFEMNNTMNSLSFNF